MLQTNLIKSSFSDHYLIALHILNKIIKSVERRNFNFKNKTYFKNKLIVADWSHLYTIKIVDKAFS